MHRPAGFRPQSRGHRPQSRIGSLRKYCQTRSKSSWPGRLDCPFCRTGGVSADERFLLVEVVADAEITALSFCKPSLRLKAFNSALWSSERAARSLDAVVEPAARLLLVGSTGFLQSHFVGCPAICQGFVSETRTLHQITAEALRGPLASAFRDNRLRHLDLVVEGRKR